MVEPIQSLQIDDVTVSVINICDFHAPLWTEWLRLTPEQWRQIDPSGPIAMVRLPILCFHLALPGYSLLVDAGAYPFDGPHPFAIPGYQPPAGLLASLASAGIDPGAIDDVVISHAHFDHYNGLTTETGGALAPCFSQARHLLGRADWDAVQAALGDPTTIEARTLGVVAAAGLLDVVDGDRALNDRVQILATPGESPGHQCVRVQLSSGVLYFLGDLYHHPAEAEHPDWCPAESDATALQHSRQRLAAMALDEQALLFASHTPSMGRLVRTPHGVRWEVDRPLGDLSSYPPTAASYDTELQNS